MTEFKELGISEPILLVLQEMGFKQPSEIQEKTIPLVINGNDIIGGAATGSGKTLAFGAGIIQRCERGKGVQALVLTPTRELAEQVATALQNFSKYRPLSVIAVYGGVPIGPQIDALGFADIVVGTPGRILDHLERRTINLTRVRTLVLDEADRMLDMGFVEDVEKIISQCPDERQTLLFSATISQDIARLSQNYMKSPVEVSVESYVDPSKLTQIYYDVPDNLKFSLLVHLLKNEDAGLVMVFCNTQSNTDFVAKNLELLGIDALAIHGKFSQQKRNSVMKQFHSGKVAVLVCTDVAARGLDISGVSHVYNYDIPKDSRQYVHRVGRTARAGREGKAINVLSSRDYENFQRVLANHDVTIVKQPLPEIPRVKIGWIEKPTRDYRSGSRSFSRPHHQHQSRRY